MASTAPRLSITGNLLSLVAGILASGYLWICPGLVVHALTRCEVRSLLPGGARSAVLGGISLPWQVETALLIAAGLLTTITVILGIVFIVNAPIQLGHFYFLRTREFLLRDTPRTRAYLLSLAGPPAYYLLHLPVDLAGSASGLLGAASLATVSTTGVFILCFGKLALRDARDPMNGVGSRVFHGYAFLVAVGLFLLVILASLLAFLCVERSPLWRGLALPFAAFSTVTSYRFIDSSFDLIVRHWIKKRTGD